MMKGLWSVLIGTAGSSAVHRATPRHTAQIILLIIAEPIKLRQYMYACTYGSARLMYGTNEHLVV